MAETEVASLLQRYGQEEWLLPASEIDFGKVLGRGASGTTYAGEYKGIKVAIKAYSLSILKNDASSVKNEMAIMSSISHPNIVAFEGLFLRQEPAPAAALVTRFAANGELGDAIYVRHLLRKKGTEVRFKIAIGLAKGLQYLHDKNIIHRDLKPANVLLDEQYQPLLTDFGFSRFMDSSGAKMTGETGSYKYMAPEVTKHQAYSSKADVYSFSILLNEIFNDERPYENLLPIHAAVGVVKKDLRPTQRKIKQRHPALAELVAKGWHADPDQRPEWAYIVQELEKARSVLGNESPAGRSGADLKVLGSLDSPRMPKIFNRMLHK